MTTNNSFGHAFIGGIMWGKIDISLNQTCGRSRHMAGSQVFQSFIDRSKALEEQADVKLEEYTLDRFNVRLYSP